MDPKSFHLHMHLGDTYSETGDLDAAMDAYTQALTIAGARESISSITRFWVSRCA